MINNVRNMLKVKKGGIKNIIYLPSILVSKYLLNIARLTPLPPFWNTLNNVKNINLGCNILLFVIEQSSLTWKEVLTHLMLHLLGDGSGGISWM